MSDLNISFENPWLLLLWIPAAAIVLYSFFRVAKKFRCTRNRVISLVLGMVAATACAAMAAGLGFSYMEANDKNELILLVDASFSNRESKEKKDQFVKKTIEENGGTARLGIVTFGYDQVYAVPLTDETDGAFDDYLNAKLPDAGATDLESALLFAKSLFSYPESGKVVVLTDGIQTDGDALNAVAALAMSGIKVDFAEYAADRTDREVQLMQVALPEQTILTGENLQLELLLQSSVKTDVRISLYDNGEQVASGYKAVVKGANRLYFTHSFETTGLHELCFRAESADDTLEQNNVLYSYVYIEVVDKVLILQRDGEAEQLRALFEEKFNAEVRDIADAPASLAALRSFDQVILMNIANADMPEGFDEILNSYVKDCGGGLLTVGGTKRENGEVVANTYDRADMQDSLYQEMLPVLAEDYTPPIAVVIVIDVSYSMTTMGPNGLTMMEEAKRGAKEGLKALDDRDYVGIVTFASTAKTVLELTPVSQKRNIENAIDKIDSEMSGTVYSNALERAGMMLKAADKVNKKHIIFISDGAPSGGDTEYLKKTEINRQAGVTTSCISYYAKVDALDNIASTGDGKTYLAYGGGGLSEAIREDLSVPEIREFEYGTFQPEIGEYASVFNNIREEDIPALDGFFGAKLKSGAHSYLVGEYGQPIYAQWDYGKGKVGSFLCDLNGGWSAGWLESGTGLQLVANFVCALFPKESIGIDEIELTTERQNYSVSTNIYTSLEEGERIQVAVNKVGADGGRTAVHVIDVENFNGNQKVYFDVTEGGIYEIEVRKLNAAGEIAAQNAVYQAFSFSEEYNPFLAEEDNSAFLAALAESGNGRCVVSPAEVFEDMITAFAREYDPRTALAIAVIAALLLDVAVRKFKFKWPHELARERKAKHAARGQRKEAVK